MVKKFSLFVLLQAFVLALMVGSHYAVEWYGDEVRLKTAPVDPRDVLYGDYVMLNYDISDIDSSKFDQIPERGDTVYVVLQKEGPYHQLVSAHLQKPSVSPYQSILKGRVEHVTNRWEPEQSEDPKLQSVHVVYGFERYYMQEGTGKGLEEKRGQFDVVIKTSPWGQQLSDLSFIANGVITQGEAQERVYQHYAKQSIPIEILRSQLVSEYDNQERPVWLVEIATNPKNSSDKATNRSTIVVDARSGEILLEKKTGK